jgi:hypothetical protein
LALIEIDPLLLEKIDAAEITVAGSHSSPEAEEEAEEEANT